MVSDAELVERIHSILRTSDLTTTSTATVRRRLEADFAIDLTEKKAFIREQVDIFLNTQLNADEPEEDIDETEEVGEEEDGSGDVDNEESDEVDEENEEEEGEEKGEGGSSKKRRLSKDTKEVKKRSGGGFTKVCGLSPQLQEFVGEPELARTEVVKKLWVYIRENNLQDPSNKRKIICDERLKTLFNVNTIDMFQMNKALTKHIWPLNSEEGNVVTTTSKPKDKTPKKEKEAPKKEKEAKRQKSGSSGFLIPLPLSDELVKFFGTGENSLSRADVIKRMWDYIKQNNLQDPADKRNILCDQKLKELFNVDSFIGFTMSKLLTSHFVKTKD